VERRWYGPDETWPVHGGPGWDETLDMARSAGWHLLTYSGHAWGQICCSREIEEPHQRVIFSTGRGSESVALSTRNLISRCRHPRDSGFDREPLNRAASLLQGAQTLVSAAFACLSSTEKTHRVEQLLEMAEMTVSEADGFLEEAVALDSAAKNDLVEGYKLAAEAGVDPGIPPAVDELAATAAAHVDDADAELARVPLTAERDALLQRSAALRQEIAELQQRIRAL